MNPTQGGENPYLQVLSQMQGGQSAGLPGGPSGPAGAGAGPTGSPAVQVGQAGGTPTPQAGGGPQGSNATKMLISALQALHSFALQAIDPQETALVRQIIVLLSSLIQKDQARSLQQSQSPMGGAQQPPAGIMGR